jgi:hypothetical protein
VGNTTIMATMRKSPTIKTSEGLDIYNASGGVLFKGEKNPCNAYVLFVRVNTGFFGIISILFRDYRFRKVKMALCYVLLAIRRISL